ncbi:MAG: VOC family protein [Steroidobacteraceae bacterium]|nr:VOC family protein [Nevskiaceae bacterium]MCP5339956.1 VOC family protein [Nevskiaceae bacterium]MCP5471045.1 VOC family protein [Nevskiaceae bacterium]
MPVSPLVRAALTVSNLERSREFYVEVLGLSEVFLDSTVEGGGNIHALMGVPDSTRTRICILKAPGTPAYGMLGLFELTRPQPPRLDFHGAGSSIGELCLVFYCPDLDAVQRAVAARGLAVIAAPVPLEVRGRIKQREMTFRGPDGEKINLIEWNLARAEAGDRPEKWSGTAAQPPAADAT